MTCSGKDGVCGFAFSAVASLTSKLCPGTAPHVGARMPGRGAPPRPMADAADHPRTVDDENRERFHQGADHHDGVVLAVARRLQRRVISAPQREESEEASAPVVPAALSELSREYNSPRQRYILAGGLDANLIFLYDPNSEVERRTVVVYVKYGNIRCDNGMTISINLQKQLQWLGITFKPVGTHMRIARFSAELTDVERNSIVADIATELGNMEHTLILEAWGRHSVFVKGPFLEAIQNALVTHGGGQVRELLGIHIELIPRLRTGEVYVEGTGSDIRRLVASR